MQELGSNLGRLEKGSRSNPNHYSSQPFTYDLILLLVIEMKANIRSYVITWIGIDSSYLVPGLIEDSLNLGHRGPWKQHQSLKAVGT